MSMATTNGAKVAHDMAHLAELFAKGHAARGQHRIARTHWLDAQRFFIECGCMDLARQAYRNACREADLAGLYEVQV